MKYFIAIFAAAAAFFLSYADDQKSDLISEEYDKLVEEQKANELKMLELRVKLIKEDPELEKLHRQIMSLHKELALKLDKKDEMKKLIEKKKRIDSELERLARKKKTENAPK